MLPNAWDGLRDRRGLAGLTGRRHWKLGERRPVIKSLSREDRRTGGEPLIHSTHSSPPQGFGLAGGVPFLCGFKVRRKRELAVSQPYASSRGGRGGKSTSGKSSRSFCSKASRST